MLKWLIPLAGICALCPICLAQREVHPEFPKQVIIGRDTFFDFGPPFDFFEIFALRSIPEGTSVERVTLTPPGHPCRQPATVESAKTMINEPLQSLLAGKNLCEIPEKVIHKEAKRCKNCLLFSGSHVTMEFQCGQTIRKARMEVLEQDWFEKSPHTPANTSWSMTLLGRLDTALGSSVIDRPAFALAGPIASPPLPPKSDLIEAIRRGDYDTLFDNTDNAPSGMFANAQKIIPKPSVSLLSSTPFQPAEVVLPSYPPIAKLARIEGKLTVDMDLDAQGHTANVTLSGPNLLQSTMEKAIISWKFGPEAGGSHIQAVFQFDLNCKELVNTSVN